jgi:hypothetical protein
MQLVTSELVNPCHLTHLITTDVQLQNAIVLMTKILKFYYNNEIPCHHYLGMMCQVHAIST